MTAAPAKKGVRPANTVRIFVMASLGAVMLTGAASTASTLDAVLLGAGGAAMLGYAFLWQTGIVGRTRNAALVMLAFACSPLVIYPLGLVIALRFLLFPAEGWQQGVGITAGLLFLSPIILIFLIAMMFAIPRRR